ncbi:SDR family NAD(P)-dependent oxidoreductase [Klebsiella aerogenes]|uniref:SDR family NAD(P)-dependent oxidoreductase n=1 Tax=Klebsiella aerogenes TaxID=548 RepID=UPI0007E49E31
MGTLIGKKAFITGSEQGIGWATAEKLILAGCDVFLHYHSGEEGPQALAAIASARGQKAAWRYADLIDTEDATAWVTLSMVVILTSNTVCQN